jgi:hypothetical protein
LVDADVEDLGLEQVARSGRPRVYERDGALPIGMARLWVIVCALVAHYVSAGAAQRSDDERS